MARKITMNGHAHKSVAEVFEDFVISQTAQGLSEMTLTNYRHHFHSISRHFDITQPMDTLTKSKLEAMVVSMRKSGLGFLLNIQLIFFQKIVYLLRPHIPISPCVCFKVFLQQQDTNCY